MPKKKRRSGDKVATSVRFSEIAHQKLWELVEQRQSEGMTSGATSLLEELIAREHKRVFGR